ncbi:MAG: DUF4337 domain-containing protein [Caldimonas sp.]
MDIDPLDTIEELQEDAEEHREHARLNAMVAIAVAVLATFLGICNVKDDNIVQGMQAAQADKIDLWNFFQARNIREEVALATIEQLTLARASRPENERAAYDASIAKYQEIARSQNTKKEALKTQAEEAQKNYDRLNFRDDQFDLAKAAIAIAIALLAVTALTHLWWLFWLAMIPSVFGIVMGIAGLGGFGFHPDILIHPLT